MNVWRKRGRTAVTLQEMNGVPRANPLRPSGRGARAAGLLSLVVAALVVAAAGLGVAVFFAFGSKGVKHWYFAEDGHGERLPAAAPEPAVRAPQEPVVQPSDRADEPAHLADPAFTDAGDENALAPAPRTAPVGLHPVLGTTTNILLLGVDRHPGVRKGGLTDTLILAALDQPRKRLGLVSIPRDLYVDVENHGPSRINAVYAYAKKDKLSLTTAFDRVLRDTLGVPVEHTVVIDLGLFERVIDELGGVDVEVPCAIRDRFVDGRVEGGRRLLDVAAGPQHMDGVTAAMYVRSRHGRSDWSRARRQQAVLLGLRNKLTQPSVLLSVPRLLSEWNEGVTTDLTSLQLLGLVRQVARLDVTRLHGVVLGHRETIPTRTEQQWSVLVPDEEAISRRLDDLYSSGLPGRGTEACLDADVALRRRAKRAD